MDIAYRSLLGESNTSAALASQMFRFALKYHSREELLFHMRWFLGPGVSYIPSLGHAFLTSNDAYEFADPYSVLSPSVDMAARAETRGDDSTLLFLGAYGIEDYLKGRGAFHIDENTIYMKVQHAGNTAIQINDVGEPSQSQFENYNLNLQTSPDNDVVPMPSQQEYAEYYTPGSAGSTVASPGGTLLDTPQLQVPKATSLAPNSMAGFFVDALLPTSGWQSMEMPPESSWVSKISTYSGGIVTINAHLLLEVITQHAFCLGGGPGYLRSSIDRVINALTTDRLRWQ